MDVTHRTLGASAGCSRQELPNISQVLLVVLLVCLQFVLFVALVRGTVGLPAYLTLHLGLCVVAAAVRLWCGFRQVCPADGIAVSLQLFLWSALAGPFGAAIVGALLIPRSLSTEGAPKPGSAGSGENTLSCVERLHNALLDQRLRLAQAYEVRPMLDVIIDGTQSEKFDALRLIGKHYTSSAAPVLKRAIEDKDASVRVLAATVMAQLHNSFVKRIGERQGTAKAAPEAPDGWSALAQAHLDYARSGLLEASRVDNELDQARSCLSRVGSLGHRDRLPQALCDLVSFGAPDRMVTSHG